jgi:hypothetical protein
MKLAELYERDITRSVDPVAKVDHRDPDTIKQEIDEYFFTDPLLKHLKTFLSNVTGGAAETTGFWINGFYGSGKSHFLKYLYYCLSDTYGSDAFEHLISSLANYEGDPLEQPFRVPEAKRLSESVEGLTVAPIMFNISAFAKKDDDDRDTVTETFALPALRSSWTRRDSSPRSRRPSRPIRVRCGTRKRLRPWTFTLTT